MYQLGNSGSYPEMCSFHLIFLLSATLVSARTFTVTNACPFTIWPAIYTDLNVGTAIPAHPTGWEALAFTSVSFAVPDNWKAGRIWGRRDCDFNRQGGPTAECLTGGCNGGLLCDAATGTGVPPATVAEFTLEASGDQDWYDVSLVDGYNLPMSITNNKGCPLADCLVDLNPECPEGLKGPAGPDGISLGCLSSCAANLDGNPTNSANCCSGQFALPETCPRTNVAHNEYFKGRCPNSYSYAYDEASGTALWTCPTSAKADYTVTFCPPTPPSVIIRSYLTSLVTSVMYRTNMQQ